MEGIDLRSVEVMGNRVERERVKAKAESKDTNALERTGRGSIEDEGEEGGSHSNLCLIGIRQAENWGRQGDTV